MSNLDALRYIGQVAQNGWHIVDIIVTQIQGRQAGHTLKTRNIQLLDVVLTGYKNLQAL